ncbi:DUF1707 SHOCT-like domain-containing protein [Plantactinospora soyae]|uniref:DUF1707 domain-containing protein n=1 Tax=Plantactinospora soyae TaxID=1544732 RepID=A0A927ME14_9ACTN|nr:DUF1707 domain-containing protein [Plantactinospora soyae]MBE1490028.1 hypothetical protein [Plantactinospora soyae]
MSGDVVPSRPEVRISDAERESVVARLNTAVAEGRLTLPEFEERIGGVLSARTYGETEPFVADLPAAAPAVAPADVVELRGHAGNIERTGRWAVPRRLVVRSKAGSVKLDLRHAVISHRTVEIELATQAGSTTIVLPPEATANIDAVTTTAGTATIKVPSMPEPGSTAPHIVITGSTAAGTLLVRYERRFWRWRW